jgi:tetratricopeptide (TPR) repeat protein
MTCDGGRTVHKEAALALAIAILAIGLFAVGRRMPPVPAVVARPSALAIVTANHPGDSALDVEIRRLQARVRAPDASRTTLEQLGLAFYEKARASADPGLLRLALACAEAMRERGGPGPDERFLAGLALHGLHRFADAEALAGALVVERGAPFDHGLLGDVLLDSGRLAEAAVAYQRMMDLRPDAQAHARAGELRFLVGDLDGSLDALETAARATSRRSAGAWAWIHARLAHVRLAAGDRNGAADAVARGRSVAPDAPALRLAEARLALAAGAPQRAVAVLAEAPAAQPTVESLWTLAEALRASARPAEAEAVERRLASHGEQLDPRAYALWLASSGRDPAAAVALARAELERRTDVYSWDVLAWTLVQAGQPAEASEASARALAEGTPEPRLWLHAGLIAAAAGDAERARTLLEQAARGAALLLPSERAALELERPGSATPRSVAVRTMSTEPTTTRRLR